MRKWHQQIYSWAPFHARELLQQLLEPRRNGEKAGVSRGRLLEPAEVDIRELVAAHHHVALVTVAHPQDVAADKGRDSCGIEIMMGAEAAAFDTVLACFNCLLYTSDAADEL